MFGRILAEAFAHPIGLGTTVAASVAGAAATLLVPDLIGRMVDQVHDLPTAAGADATAARTALLVSAVLVVAAATGRGVMAMVSNYLGERLSQKVACELRVRYFDPRASLGTPEDYDVFGTLDAGVARRLFAYLRPHRLTLAAAQGAALASVASQLLVPLAVGRVLDAAVARSSGALGLWLLLFGAASAIYVVMFFLEPWLSQRLTQRIINTLRRDMFVHLQKVSLSFLDTTHVGRLMARLQGDVGTLQEVLEGTTGVLGDVVTLVGVAVMLLVLDLKLALATLITLPVMVGLRALWLPHSQRAFQRARDASSAGNSALAENINGVRTVQGARREELNLELYREKAVANFRAQSHAVAVAQIMTPTVDFLTGAALAAVFVLGGEAVLDRRLDVGVLVAFVLYVQRFFEPVRTLSMQYTQSQKAVAAARRVFELLDVPLTLRPPGPPQNASLRGRRPELR